MKRVAVIGGGISGLTAAYELEKARIAGAAIDWHLYEASDRLGGIVETTVRDGFLLEGGPDGWVSEKTWLRDLCVELGLESELIFSNDATRKTYIAIDGELVAMPERMRLFVPEDLSALEGSPLFSDDARAAYAAEVSRAEELRARSPFVDDAYDESIAVFVRRHFGEEVLVKLAAPLLSGVFGGDVEKLSVRAVMAPFVAMELECGSLVTALARRRESRVASSESGGIFTSLRGGMGTVVDALVRQLPAERVRLKATAQLDSDFWTVVCTGDPRQNYLLGVRKPQRFRSREDAAERYDEIFLATPLEVTRNILIVTPFHSLQHELPFHASSSVLISFAWKESFALPGGFGFLVTAGRIGGAEAENAGLSAASSRWGCEDSGRDDKFVGGAEEGKCKGPSTVSARGTGSGRDDEVVGRGKKSVSLLACTFADQKFVGRAPEGGRVMRAYFGGASADALANASDADVAALALRELRSYLGTLPEPSFAVVRRWPRSLPQYEVGHVQRMQRLEKLVADVPGLTLLGNSYRGVGLPDLVRDAQAAVKAIVSQV